jgi:anti-sigma factor RsiW
MPPTLVIDHPSDAHLVSYMDDELPPEQREDVRRHIASCLVCRKAIEDLATWSVQVGRAAHEMDREEPSRWRAPTTPLMPGRRPSERATPRRLPRQTVRWAATILVVAGGVASAAIVGPIVRRAFLERQPAPEAARMTGVPDSVPPVTVGSIGLPPVNDAFTVELSEAGVGSRVVVHLTDRSDVGVRLSADSSQAATPRYTTGDGRVLVQLAQRVVIVNVEFPRGIREGRVVAGGRVLARVADARVEPDSAATRGIEIATPRP